MLLITSARHRQRRTDINRVLQNCATNVDECGSSPCRHGGRCADGLNSYECRCAAGWLGDNCETNRDECGSSPCRHGAACTDGIDAYSCTCTTGFSGQDCATDVDDCASNPCGNTGACNDLVDAYACTCVLGWAGVQCDTEIDNCRGGEAHCDPIYAACIHTGPGSHRCDCSPGYETHDAGATCTQSESGSRAL